MSTLLQLSVTRDIIATFVAARRAPRTNQYVISRRAPRTNQYVISRLTSFSGEVRAFIPRNGWVQMSKAAVQQLLDEAGRQQPAIATFRVRQGVGYLTPVNR
jgi:hypothetical protein